MKVLTLTIQNAKNMGAQLQCYALSKFLNSQDDIECKVIKYYPIRYNISWQYFKIPTSFKGLLLFFYKCIRLDQYVNFREKNKVMKSFMENYIPLTSNAYSRKEILDNPPVADAIVCGSDQIWNFKLRKDLTYLLDFVKDKHTKRIAYAASMAEPWTEEECNEAKPLLNKFNAVSIREEGNLSMINSLLKNKTAQVVVDPIFLLGKDEWERFSKKSNISVPYILCYFLGTDDYTVQSVKKIKKLTGLKIVHLNLNNRDRFNSDYEIKIADPRDFIGLIQNASIVCTNSFHCTAFSIIFRKNIINIPRYLGNLRIKSLEKIFNIPNIVLDKATYNNLTLKNLKTDYSRCDDAIKQMIEMSKQFLLDSLYERN